MKFLQILVFVLFALFFSGCLNEAQLFFSKENGEVKSFFRHDSSESSFEPKDLTRPDDLAKLGIKPPCKNTFAGLRALGAQVFFVAPTTKNSGHNCLTWQTACSLSQAIKQFGNLRSLHHKKRKSSEKVYIIVAKGTYTYADEDDSMRSEGVGGIGFDGSLISLDKIAQGIFSLDIRGGFSLGDVCLEDNGSHQSILDGQKKSGSVILLRSQNMMKDITLKNFIIKGGVAHGAKRQHDLALELAAQSGAGLSIQAIATNIALENLTFENNEAKNTGGCFDINGTITGLTLKNIVASQCQAKNGGGAAHFGGKISKLLIDGFAISYSQTSKNGGGVLLDGTVSGTFNNVAIKNCFSKYQGGALAIVAHKSNTHKRTGDMGDLFFADAKFSFNHADGQGGAIAIYGEPAASPISVIGNAIDEPNYKIKFQGAVVEKNSASFGGGYAFLDGVDEGIKIEDGLISANHATKDGGGMYAMGNIANVKLSGNVTVIHNQANVGAGIYFDGTSDLSLQGAVTVKNNRAHQKCGGGFFGNTSVDMAGLAILENISHKDGGGFCFVDSVVKTHENMVYRGNKALSGQGGALWQHGGSLIFAKTTIFDDNQALGDGGALYLASINNLFLKDNDSTLSMKDNKSINGNGGAIYASFTPTSFLMRLNGSTFSNNHADGDKKSGGALYLAKVPSTIDLSGMKFNGNTCHTNGAGLHIDEKAGPITSLVTANSINVTNDTFYFIVSLGTEFKFNKNKVGNGAGIFVGSAIMNKVVLKGRYYGNEAKEGSGGAIAFMGPVNADFTTKGDEGRTGTINVLADHVLFAYNVAQKNPTIHFEQMQANSALAKLDSLEFINTDFLYNFRDEFGDGGVLSLEKPLNTFKLTNGIARHNGRNISDEYMTNNGGAFALDSVTSSIDIQKFTAIDHHAHHGNGGFLFVRHATAALPKLTIDQDSHILYNNSDQDGGAFYVEGASSVVINGQIKHNWSITGGGGLHFNELLGDLNLDGATVSGNISYDGNGGGINIIKPLLGNLIISNRAVISNNQALNGNGGAIHLTGGANSIDISSPYRFADFMKAIILRAQGPTKRQSTDYKAVEPAEKLTRITGNQAKNGGALYIQGLHGAAQGYSKIKSVFWHGNSASAGDGGGFYLENCIPKVYIIDSIFRENKAEAGSGGGGYISFSAGNRNSVEIFGNQNTSGKGTGWFSNPPPTLDKSQIWPVGKALQTDYSLDFFNDFQQKNQSTGVRVFLMEKNVANLGPAFFIKDATAIQVEGISFNNNKPKGSPIAVGGITYAPDLTINNNVVYSP